MALTTPRTMPGVLELLPREQIAFQRMLDTIRRGFEVYGFLPIETPAIEFADVLLTKSGGETERQVYFVQSTGGLEKMNALGKMALESDGFRSGAVELPPTGRPELALRFDLTVPLARYVAEHERDLAFPFRRYQMQRVYRGERAQRGRFREFYQCDIDVIGKDTLSVRYDAEIPAVIHAVFRTLDIGTFTIRINNRKLLKGVLQALGIDDAVAQTAVLREIDKTDKRGRDATYQALIQLGLSSVTVATLLYVLYESCSDKERKDRDGICQANLEQGLPPIQASTDPDLMLLGHLPTLISGVSWPDSLQEGVVELEETLQTIAALGVPRESYCLDLSIARGLDYYTGTVYETTLDGHPEIGSICSGGRYDNLAANYTKSNLPGVGISIGLTRLFWQLREAGLLKTANSTVQVLVTQMDAAQLPVCLAIAKELRDAGIATEVALEGGKLGKQLKYADRVGIRFAVVAGEDELARGAVAVKDLRRGDQSEVPRAELVKSLRVELAQGEAGIGGESSPSWRQSHDHP